MCGLCEMKRKSDIAGVMAAPQPESCTQITSSNKPILAIAGRQPAVREARPADHDGPELTDLGVNAELPHLAPLGCWEGLIAAALVVLAVLAIWLMATGAITPP